MKKLLALILAGLMVFSLCACKKGGDAETGEAPAIDEVASVEVVRAYIASFINGDGKTRFELEMDPHKLDAAIERGTYADKDDALAFYVEATEEDAGYLEGDYVVDGEFEIKEIKTTKYSDEDVRKINKYLEDEKGYPADYMHGVEVVEVEITYMSDGGSESSTDEVVVTRIDNKKYVDNIIGAYGTYDIKEILEDY